MSLQQRERETYDTIWAFEDYATYAPGERYADVFLDMAQLRVPRAEWTVLDAGCGSGKGALALKARGVGHVRMCDLTPAGLTDEARGLQFSEACLWEPLRPQLGYLTGGSVDYVYCCDVLEHVPPQFTMLTVSRLLEIARSGVFLSIALHRDEFGAFIGKPLHRTVESFVWWRDNLRELGTIIECRDMGANAVFLVGPR